MNRPVLEVPATGVNGERPKEVRRALVTSALAYCLIAIICVLVLNSIYKLWHTDLRIPLVDKWDATFYDALVKNFVETGHYFVNPSLGAPGVQEMYDFPLPHATHLLGLAVLKLFTNDYGAVVNLYYLLSFVLEAMTAFYVFQRFGISTGLGIAGGVLFAFLPFHLVRSQGHLIHTSYYLVPLVVMVILWVCQGIPLFAFETGGQFSWKALFTREGLISVFICVLIASDNPYWAFFSGIFLIVAGILGTFRYGHRRALLAGAILSAIVALVFCLNLLPNLIYARSHGLNPVNHRPPMQAEVYGLRITQMVLPVTGHRIQALAKLKAKYDTQAPMVNENQTATLGIIGTLGFLALLGCFFAKRIGPHLHSLSILNISAVLIATIGGLGAVFNFTIWSQIRCYNRISVFIAFFSFFAVLLLADRLLLARVGPSRAHAASVVAFVLLSIGLLDEIPKHFVFARSVVEATYHQDQAYISRIERSLPLHSMIFQLPYVAFLGPAPPNTAMVQYDELKGYLHSRTLRWSSGAMIGRDTDRWLREISAKPFDQLVSAAAAAGFSGIYIDRFGYADRAASTESQLKALLNIDPVVSEDGRRSFFPLDPTVVKAMQARVRATQQAHFEIHPSEVSARVGNGCSPMEGTPEFNWHWCEKDGEIVIYNPSNKIRTVTLDAVFTTGYHDVSKFTINGFGFSRTLHLNDTDTALKANFAALPGISTLRLISNAKAIVAAKDPRTMVFRISNLHCQDLVTTK